MALVTSWSGDRFHPAVIRSLAVNPDQLPDEDLLRCGFLIHEKLFGKWTLTYRLDVPVKQVLILAIRS